MLLLRPPWPQHSGPVLTWARGLTAPCLCQSVVGAEGLSLAFRHIASSLLGHCSQVSCESLLHEVIVCVGFFTVNHPDNQVRGPEGPRGCSPALRVRYWGERRQSGLPEPSFLPEALHRLSCCVYDVSTRRLGQHRVSTRASSQSYSRKTTDHSGTGGECCIIEEKKEAWQAGGFEQQSIGGEREFGVAMVSHWLSSKVSLAALVAGRGEDLSSSCWGRKVRELLPEVQGLQGIYLLSACVTNAGWWWARLLSQPPGSIQMRFTLFACGSFSASTFKDGVTLCLNQL